MSNNTNSADKSRVSLSYGIAYALPTLAVHLLVAPIGILQGIYAKYFGLALTTIAAVVLAARLFDAITDPLIGYFSDRYRARNGTRKPFVVAGGLLVIICGYFLYVPPQGVSSLYFLGWFLAFFLAWTLFEIPHLAWGGELAGDSDEKTKIYTLRMSCLHLGALLFFVVPLLPLFESSEITPQTLEVSVWVMGLFAVPLLYLCVKTVPDGYGVQSPKQQGLRQVLKAVLLNRPLVIFLTAYLFMGIGAGMWLGLAFIFIDIYLGLGDKVAFIYILLGLVSIAFSIAAFKLTVWFGKKAVWSAAIIMAAIAVAGNALLQPGEATYGYLLVLAVCAQAGFATALVVAPSLLSDIVDYGMWKFGADRAAMYFSVYTLVTKANAAIGAALGLAIAGWYGFDAAAIEHSAASVFGLRLGIAYIPAVIILIAVAFIALLPLNARRHKAIRRRLQAREKAAAAQSISPA